MEMRPSREHLTHDVSWRLRRTFIRPRPESSRLVNGATPSAIELVSIANVCHAYIDRVTSGSPGPVRLRRRRQTGQGNRCQVPKKRDVPGNCDQSHGHGVYRCSTFWRTSQFHSSPESVSYISENGEYLTNCEHCYSFPKFELLSRNWIDLPTHNSEIAWNLIFNMESTFKLWQRFE